MATISVKAEALKALAYQIFGTSYGITQKGTEVPEEVKKIGSTKYAKMSEEDLTAFVLKNLPTASQTAQLIDTDPLAARALGSLSSEGVLPQLAKLYPNGEASYIPPESIRRQFEANPDAIRKQALRQYDTLRKRMERLPEVSPIRTEWNEYRRQFKDLTGMPVVTALKKGTQFDFTKALSDILKFTRNPQTSKKLSQLRNIHYLNSPLTRALIGKPQEIRDDYYYVFNAIKNDYPEIYNSDTVDLVTGMNENEIRTLAGEMRTAKAETGARYPLPKLIKEDLENMHADVVVQYRNNARGDRLEHWYKKGKDMPLSYQWIDIITGPTEWWGGKR